MSISKLGLLLLTTFALFLESCSVGMALSGNKEPDLSVIKVGADRSDVELQLGAPKESSNVSGDNFAIYEYELGNESSAGRAVAHGAMDILTLGIWEVVGTPVELATGGHHKLMVFYDQNNKVKLMKKMNAS